MVMNNEANASDGGRGTGDDRKHVSESSKKAPLYEDKSSRREGSWVGKYKYNSDELIRTYLPSFPTIIACIGLGCICALIAFATTPRTFRAIGTIMVDQLPFREEKQIDSESERQMVQALIMGISNRSMRVATEKDLNLPPGCIAFAGLDRPLSFLNSETKANVQISILRGSRLANITADSQSPQFAADVVNSILDHLKVYNGIGGMIKDLETQISFTKSQSDITITQLSDITTQQLKLQQESDQLEDYIKKGFPLPNYPTFAQDSTLNNLKTQLFLIDSEYKALASTSTRGARLEGQSNELKSLRHQLEVYSEKLVESLRAEYGIKSSQQKGLQQIVQKNTAKLQDLNQRCSQLVGTFGKPEQMQAMSSDKYQASANIIVVLNAAVPPPRPYWPNLTLYIILGIGLGGALGFLISTVKFYWDKKIVSIPQVEIELEVACLEMLPKRSSFSVDVLHKTTPLIKQDGSKSHLYLTKLLSLRSYFLTHQIMSKGGVFGWVPVANQNSAVLLADLARVLSDSGKRILIADCDFVHSEIAQHLGIEVRHGLKEWVLSSLPLSDFFNKDTTGRISLLSSGVQAMELMNNLFPRPLYLEWDGFIDQFDFIFIYTATARDQVLPLSLPKFYPVILTVDYGITMMSQLIRMIALIRRLRWRVDGIIMTNAPSSVVSD